jgi:hypothetical protein
MCLKTKRFKDFLMSHPSCIWFFRKCLFIYNSEQKIMPSYGDHSKQNVIFLLNLQHLPFSVRPFSHSGCTVPHRQYNFYLRQGP